MLSDAFTQQTDPKTSRDFDKAVQEYVSTLYLMMRNPITFIDAQQRGQDLLNQHYEPGNAFGYDVALVDVVKEQTVAMDQIYRILSDATQQTLLAIHQNHIMKRSSKMLQWSEKCQLAEWIKNDLLPLGTDAIHPDENIARMAAHLEDWIQVVVETR
jgi:hypothetical protein